MIIVMLVLVVGSTVKVTKCAGYSLQMLLLQAFFLAAEYIR